MPRVRAVYTEKGKDGIALMRAAYLSERSLPQVLDDDILIEKRVALGVASEVNLLCVSEIFCRERQCPALGHQGRGRRASRSPGSFGRRRVTHDVAHRGHLATSCGESHLLPRVRA